MSNETEVQTITPDDVGTIEATDVVKKEKRTRTDRGTFLRAVKAAMYDDAAGDRQINHQEVSDSLGIAKSSVQTRLSTLRNQLGLSKLPKGKQGGAAKTDEQKQTEAQNLFAEIFGDELG